MINALRSAATRRTPAPRTPILGVDKGYDYDAAGLHRRPTVAPRHAARGRRWPCVEVGTRRTSGVDGRTMRRPGYAASQRVRKRIEEVFGWIKGAAGLRQTKHRGGQRVECCFALATTAYNLIRLPRLLARTPA